VFKLRIKECFFDRKAVMDMMSAVTVKMLGYFGGYTRKVAKSSIKKQAGPSAPGTPPHSHTGLLRDHIYYACERGKVNVVIGPEKLEGLKTYGITTTPELQEYGGMVEVPAGRGRRGEHKAALFPDRPYMHPAFETAKEHLPEVWAQAVRR